MAKPKRTRQNYAWKEYAERFCEEVMPQLEKSACLLQIYDGVPDKIDIDVIRAATELGMMLMLDKPLVVVVPQGLTVNDTMRRAAVLVIENIDLESKADQDLVARMIRGLGQP